MATQGALVKASDLSAYLTADTVMDALDIEALKEVLDVGSSGGAKVVGSAGGSFNNSSATLTITLPTADYDYLEIKSYPIADGRYYYSGSSVTQYPNAHNDMFTPIICIISKNATSGNITIKYRRNDDYWTSSSSSTTDYISSKATSYTLSGTTFTMSVPYWQGVSSNSPTTSYSYYGSIDVVQYKY